MKGFASPSALAATWLLTLLAPAMLHAEANWPQFRGPTGRGHTADTDVPLQWDASKVAWKTELKGSGQSSPVTWGNQLFVTSASADGTERYLTSLDRNTGKLLWEQTIQCAAPEQNHKMNTWATPTPATDGEVVAAFFGPGGLHVFDLEGKKLWSEQLGDFPGSWGVAASPILMGKFLVQNTDAEGPSALIAFDKQTGKVMWKTPREDKPKGGWSTPILIDTGTRKELVLNGEYGVRGYDPATGKELWFCKGFNGRGSPVPDFDGKTLYVVNGKPGDMYAVKPGGSGDVTDSHMLWHAERRGGRDLPSPAAVGGYVLVTSMSGIASCYDAETGDVLWSERLGAAGEFAASPLVANGHVYLQNVFGGDVFVIKPGPQLDIVAQNSLGAGSQEVFRSTLAPVDGKLYARSHTTVYCVAP